MSAYLKKFVDVEVKLIDFNVELNHTDEFPFTSFEAYCRDFLNKLDFKPNLIGVSSLFSPSLHNFIACGQVAKEIWPEALVVDTGNTLKHKVNFVFDLLFLILFLIYFLFYFLSLIIVYFSTLYSFSYLI
jgi:hypothetical protein